MSEETKIPFTFVDAPQIRGGTVLAEEGAAVTPRRRQRSQPIAEGSAGTPDSFTTFSLIVSALVAHPPVERKRIVDTLTNLYR